MWGESGICTKSWIILDRFAIFSFLVSSLNAEAVLNAKGAAVVASKRVQTGWECLGAPGSAPYPFYRSPIPSRPM